MKLLKRLIIASGIIFLLLFIFLATIIFVGMSLRVKDLVEYEIEQELGINVTISSIHCSPLFAQIVAKGVTVHNPAGFTEPELAYINSIRLVFDPLEAIIQRKPNIYLFAIDIERLNVVRNAQKKINIQEIIPKKKTEAVSESQTPFYFDVMMVSIAKVNFLDYASGKKKTSSYPVRIKNATFVNLRNGSEVVRMIVFEALRYTEIGKLLHMTVIPVVSQVNNTVSAAWGATKTGAKSMWEIVSMPFHLITGH